MIAVDAHQHFWNPTSAVYPWMETKEFAHIRRVFAPTDLRPLLDAAGIQVSVFVQCRHDEAETEEQLAATLSHPWIAGVVGWVNLEASDVADRIARLRAMPGGDRLVGIRHIVHDEPDPGWLERPAVIRGLKAVAAAGLAYDLLVRSRELPAAIAAVRAVPDGRFVLDHAAKPPIARGWDPIWAARLEEVAREPNVLCKLSGLVTEADWTSWRYADLERSCRLAIMSFGPKRLMYGSDWPVCLLAASYAQVKTTFDEAVAGFSQTERAAVMGGNASAFYQLKLDRHADLSGGVER
jgi:L-fuconolactonase